MYNPKFKPKQVKIGTGATVIVTGWTVVDIVLKRLKNEDYAAIGNLYNASRGISFLLRNIFLNPYISRVLILNATKEDKSAASSQLLFDFFVNGVEKILYEGKPKWQIKSDAGTGLIDYEIDEDSLNSLRENVEFDMFDSVKGLVKAAKIPSPAKNWASPMEFTYIEPKSNTVPGEIFGNTIYAENIGEGWVKLLHKIRTNGVVRPTGYGGKWQELIDLTVVVSNEPLYEPYVSGHGREIIKWRGFEIQDFMPVTEKSINEYIPTITQNGEYKENIKYTYGQRIFSYFGKNQYEQVLQKLVSEKDSASCVISLWDSGNGSNKIGFVERHKRPWNYSDHDFGGSPCLNHIWFRIVGGELHMTALFRSNDMFGAWVSNAMGLRALQSEMLHELNQIVQENAEIDKVDPSHDKFTKIGKLITISQSAHIYDDCWEYADNLIKNQYQKIMHRKTYDDPVGNFIIEVEDDDIKVTHTGYDGLPVNIIFGKNPLKLIDKITSYCTHIQPYHIGYLGMELQKASDCIKNRTTYVQQ